MDPTLKSRIEMTLKGQISHLSPQLRIAAKYVIDRPSDFGLDPIRDTARKAGVSTYTFVKLSKNIGFSGFEDMRAPFRHALVSSTNIVNEPEWMKDIRADGGIGNVYADAAKNTLSIVKSSLERQHIDQLEGIADALFSAKTVYLTAVRSSYAMAYYLHYVGRMALPTMDLIPRHMNSAIDDLSGAGDGDILIAITVTPYSRETIEACEFARKKGVKLLLITDSEVVFPNFEPDFCLVSSVLSTHQFGCFAGMLATIEVLIALLVHKGKSKAQERIESYAELRKENNAYWVRPKKH